MKQENLEDFNISNDDPDEEIIKIFNVHFLVLLPNMLKIVAVLMINVLFIYFFGFGPFMRIIAIFGFLFIAYYTFYTYHLWHHDLYILTNKRIICINQHSLLHRSVSEATLDRILSTQYDLRGILQNYLNYGDVNLKIAGFRDGLTLRSVPDPYQVQLDFITAQRQKLKNDLAANQVPVSKKNHQEKIVLR